ncbi:hypothetical protein L195_g063672, partial [Trifolium pratense]
MKLSLVPLPPIENQ